MKNYTRTRSSWPGITRTGSKYHSSHTSVDGIDFSSKKEANRYLELKLLERAHQISDLRLQVKYELIAKSKYGRAINYIADFVYFENGEEIIEDVKGFKTPVYKLKKRMIAEKYDKEIRET